MQYYEKKNYGTTRVFFLVQVTYEGGSDLPFCPFRLC